MGGNKNVIGFPLRGSGRHSTEKAPAGSAAEDAERRPDRTAAGLGAMSARLLAVAERGDRAAFADLYRHFGPRVRAYLLRAGGDASRVDDILQETFAAVWRKAGQYDSGRASAAAWIFAIARNQRIDAFRRDRRPEFDPDDPAFRPGPPPEGEETLATRERDEAVRAALAALSEEQREVLRLSFFEGETYAAIAIHTGIPLGTVKSRARLAFGNLREELRSRREELR